MRRKDTEITDNNIINTIIKNEKCCRLGFCDNDTAYIVPMSFGFVQEDKKRILYFHSAFEGRKIELLKKAIESNKKIAFEIDSEPKVDGKETACTYTVHFFSIMGLGIPSFVEDKEEKILALQEIMFQNTNKRDWTFSDNNVKTVCIFKLEITEISAKEKK